MTTERPARIESGARASKATMRTALLGIGLVAALAGTGTASADSYEDEPFKKPRNELGFGMLVGGYDVGPVGGPGVGVHLDAGRRMGALFLLGEYNLLSVGESSYDNPDPIRGRMHRFGAAARYNFADFGGGRYTPIMGAFWLEAGLGWQIVEWDEGGVLRRNDLSLGFGAEMDIRQKSKDRFWSIYYAFRATIAKAPPSKGDDVATCGGPCDEPTPPSPYDLGLFFNMGFTFGK